MSDVQLRPLKRSMADVTRSWLLDDDLRDRLGTLNPPSEFEHEQWMAKQASDPSRLVRVIEYRDEPVGMCGLLHVDLTYRNAEVWLYVAEGRGGGVGRAAITQMLDHSFRTIGLHRVGARVFGFNRPALQFFAGLGFAAEGVEREAVFKKGRFHDVHLFGLLASEFAAWG